MTIWQVVVLKDGYTIDETLFEDFLDAMNGFKETYEEKRTDSDLGMFCHDADGRSWAFNDGTEIQLCPIYLVKKGEWK